MSEKKQTEELFKSGATKEQIDLICNPEVTKEQRIQHITSSMLQNRLYGNYLKTISDPEEQKDIALLFFNEVKYLNAATLRDEELENRIAAFTIAFYHDLKKAGFEVHVTETSKDTIEYDGKTYEFVHRRHTIVWGEENDFSDTDALKSLEIYKQYRKVVVSILIPIVREVGSWAIFMDTLVAQK